MAKFLVINKKTNEAIKPGDKVTSFRGDTEVFEMVSRGPEQGKSAKVIVGGMEYYAEVWDLVVSVRP
jgi:hypothetical protein